MPANSGNLSDPLHGAILTINPFTMATIKQNEKKNTLKCLSLNSRDQCKHSLSSFELQMSVLVQERKEEMQFSLLLGAFCRFPVALQ